ncbi:hypothetical protein AVEN_189854-1 [Araneus ventricosus]|uniref:Uncharacterized protein n=1 Tax=Araneus ventricosus TaxID=182803 RepID=A0A4Y2EGR9_ARAVE|nr:hypothetical protein AVEN_189854-1 [Araneus ventricosus]
MSLQCKLAASSSHGDFEAFVNLPRACTLVMTNLWQACTLVVTFKFVCFKPNYIWECCDHFIVACVIPGLKSWIGSEVRCKWQPRALRFIKAAVTLVEALHRHGVQGVHTSVRGNCLEPAYPSSTKLRLIPPRGTTTSLKKNV